MATKSTSRITYFLAPAVAFVAILIAWEFTVRALEVPQYLLPAPSAIVIDFIVNIHTLAFHTGITLWEAFLGFALANAIGVLVAIVFAHSSTLEKGLYPYAIALKTTPIIAMAPLLLLWFGNGISSKVAAAALIAFFPAIVNTTKGLKAVDTEALDLLRSLSATKWQIFTKLRLPNALPYIFSALKISTSLAVVGAIVGEFVGANRGIGYLILVNSYHLEIVKMFSAVIAAALAGILFFWVVVLLEKRVIFWVKNNE